MVGGHKTDAGLLSGRFRLGFGGLTEVDMSFCSNHSWWDRRCLGFHRSSAEFSMTKICRMATNCLLQQYISGSRGMQSSKFGIIVFVTYEDVRGPIQMRY